jgi:hypothetical protein
MKKDMLRKVEFVEIREDEYRKLSPFEKTKAAAKRERKHGYFHCWTSDTPIAGKEADLLPQVLSGTQAIVEQQDGSIIKIWPENIRFID